MINTNPSLNTNPAMVISKLIWAVVIFVVSIMVLVGSITAYINQHTPITPAHVGGK